MNGKEFQFDNNQSRNIASLEISEYLDEQNKSKQNLSSLYYSFEKENNNELEEFENSKILVCKFCNNIYTINFNNIASVNATCKCSYIINFFIDDYLKQVITDKIKLDNLICNIHKKKYDFYCHDCNKDLCEDCISSNFCHEEHTFFYFYNYLRPENLNEKIDYRNTIQAENVKDSIKSTTTENSTYIE